MQIRSVVALAMVVCMANQCGDRPEAKMVTQTVDYEQGGTALEGYLAYDDSLSSQRPGLLSCTAWRGDHGRMSAGGRAARATGTTFRLLRPTSMAKGVRPSDSSRLAPRPASTAPDRRAVTVRARRPGWTS